MMLVANNFQLVQTVPAFVFWFHWIGRGNKIS